jgi:hypothetical protein
MWIEVDERESGVHDVDHRFDHDWKPSSGLGPPVVVLDPDDLKVLEGNDTSVTLVGMKCINATVNLNP